MADSRAFVETLNWGNAGSSHSECPDAGDRAWGRGTKSRLDCCRASRQTSLEEQKMEG